MGKVTRRCLSFVLAFALAISLAYADGAVYQVQAENNIWDGGNDSYKTSKDGMWMYQKPPAADIANSTEEVKVKVVKYLGTEASIALPTELDGYKVVGVMQEPLYGNSTKDVSILPECVTSIVIPGTYESVSGFTDNKTLQSVELKEGVKSVSYNAFSGCEKLEHVTFGNGISLGVSSFEGCTRLKQLDFPKEFTFYEYNRSPFENCENLEKITVDKENKVYDSREDCNAVIKKEGDELVLGCSGTKIPSSVKAISRYAFLGSGIKEVEIPDGVKKVDGFYNCKKLEKITLPSSVEEINSNAFRGCENLTKIEIPDSVRTIWSYAFQGCSKLSEIKLPESLPEHTYLNIESHAFEDCSSITEFEVPNYARISKYTFANCTALKEVGIPYYGGDVFEGCFSGCANLETIYNTGHKGAPLYVREVDMGAFKDCVKLESISFDMSLQTIDTDAFSGCESLKEISFKMPLSSFGKSVFKGCKNLSKFDIIMMKNMYSIRESTFDGCSSLETFTFPTGIGAIEKNAFRGCSKLTSVMIPKNVNKIDASAYQNCTGLTSVTVDEANETYKSVDNTVIEKATNKLVFGCGTSKIPDGVESITASAFESCDSITEINIPASVKEIEKDAFKNCTNLTKVTIADGVEKISDGAFSGCAKLTEIAIPKSVKEIGIEAFKDCTSLTKVTIANGVEKIADSVFSGCAKLTEITIPASVKEIGKEAFEGCESVVEATLPEGITNIPANLFKDCAKLSKIIIPNGVESIENNAFENCAAATEIVIPDSVLSVGESAFKGCAGATSITLSTKMTTLGKNSFENCSSVTEIEVPGSLEDVSESAFAGCSALEKITTQEGTKNILSKAFAGCKNVKELYISSSVSQIAEDAIVDCTNLEKIEVDSDNFKYSSDKDNVLIDKYNDRTIIKGCKNSVLPTDYLNYKIGAGAFKDCKGLEKIEIPKNVTAMAVDSFENCTDLKLIVYGGTRVEWNKLTESIEGWDKTLSEDLKVECEENRQLEEMKKIWDFTVEEDGTATLTKYNYEAVTSGSGSIVIPKYLGDHLVAKVGNPTIFQRKNEVNEETGMSISTAAYMLTIPNTIKDLGSLVLATSTTTVNFEGTQEEWNAIKNNDITYTTGSGVWVSVKDENGYTNGNKIKSVETPDVDEVNKPVPPAPPRTSPWMYSMVDEESAIITSYDQFFYGTREEFKQKYFTIPSWVDDYKVVGVSSFSLNGLFFEEGASLTIPSTIKSLDNLMLPTEIKTVYYKGTVDEWNKIVGNQIIYNNGSGVWVTCYDESDWGYVDIKSKDTPDIEEVNGKRYSDANNNNSGNNGNANGGNASSGNVNGGNTNSNNNAVTTPAAPTVAPASTQAPASSVTAPGKVKLSSVKAKLGKKLVLKFKKVKSAKGYEITCALDKKFKKGKITKTTSKVTYTMKCKKAGTYYVRVRAYNTDANGKKVYGKFSVVKKVKLK